MDGLERHRGAGREQLLQGVLDQLIDQALLAAEVSTDPADDPLAVKVHLQNERRASLAASRQDIAPVPAEAFTAWVGDAASGSLLAMATARRNARSASARSAM